MKQIYLQGKEEAPDAGLELVSVSDARDNINTNLPVILAPCRVPKGGTLILLGSCPSNRSCISEDFAM